MKRIILVFGLLMANLFAHSQCSINGPYNITPLGTTDVYFDIEGLTNDDLSAGQSLCKVILGFEHRFVSQLEITITSPAGQSVTLTGPSNPTSTISTQNVIWNVQFVASSLPAFGDGFDPVWDNDNAWEVFNTYTGNYYPFQGNLEDLNTGSANGQWHVELNDLGENGNGRLNYVEIQFCDQDGLACSPCFADAGSFNNIVSNVFCSGDPNLSNLSFFNLRGVSSSFANDDYNYVISQGDNIVDFKGNFDLSDLNTGTYTLCGVINQTPDNDALGMFTSLSALQDALSSSDFCGAIMDAGDCVNIIIESPSSPASEERREICPGEIIEVDGLTFYEQTDTTVYTYTAFGCASVTRYIIDEILLEARINTNNTTIDCDGTLALNATSSVSSNGINSYNWSTESGNLVNSSGPVVQATEPGLYVLEITDGSCTDVTMVTVTGGASFDNTIELTSDNIGCGSASAGLYATVTGSYTSLEWSGPGISDPTTLEQTVTQPGTYTLTVFSDNVNCPSVSNSIIVESQTDAPTPIFNNYGSVACNDFIEIFVVNNLPIVESYWINPAGDTIGRDPIINISAGGTYTYGYTDKFGCSKETTVPVSSDAGDVSIAPTIDSLGCGDFTGQIFLNIDGDYDKIIWSGPNQFFSSNPSPTVELPGNYRVIVETAGGCMLFDTIRMVYNEAEAFNLSTNFPRITCNEREVTVRVLTSGNYDYEWSKENVPGVLGTNQILDVMEGGDYFVTVTRPSDGCAIKLYSFVALDTFPALFNFLDDKIDCDSPQLPIMSDAVDYEFESIQWIGPGITPANANEITPIVDQIGVYNVTGVTGNGCPFDNTVEIFEDFEAINLDVSDDTFILDCFTANVPVVINSDREGTFVYTNPNNIEFTKENEDRLQLFMDLTGQYTITVTGSNGCTDQVVYTVDPGALPPTVELDPAQNLDCVTDMVNLNAVVGADTEFVEWNHDATETATSIDITEPQLYIVSAYNNGGLCVETDSITIEDVSREVPLMLSADSITCISNQAIVKIDNPEPGLTYEWSDEDGIIGITESITVSDITTYYLSVVADDGCIGLDSVSIDFDTVRIETLFLPIDTINCIQDMVAAELDPLAENFAKLDSVRWYLDGDLLVNSGADASMLAQGGNYTVEVVADNGCISMVDLEIFENKVFPEVELLTDTISCLNDVVQVNANIISAMDPTTSWSSEGLLTFDEIDPMAIEVENPGNYVFIVEDINGCISMDTILVAENRDLPGTIALGMDVSCDTLAKPITFLNDDPSVNLTLTSPSGTTIDDPRNAMLSEPGIYMLEAVGANGCVSAVPFAVNGDLEPPAATISGTNIDCFNEDSEICLVVADDVRTTEWQQDGTAFVNTDDCYTTAVPGTFEVILTGTNGCVDTLTQLVEIFEPISLATVAEVDPLCFDEPTGQIFVSDVVGGTGPLSYAINEGSFDEFDVFDNLPSGEYNVTVMDSIGCTYESVTTLDDGREITIDLGRDTMIKLGDIYEISPVLNIDPVEVSSIVWGTSGSPFECTDPTCFSITVNPSSTTTYNVAITDINGCIEEQSITINVDESLPVFVPNIFRPDSEIGGNLVLQAASHVVLNVERFIILDRWGNTVYESYDFPPGDPTGEWDGNHNGKPVNPGVFMYIAELLLLDGQPRVITGDITLIR